MDDSYFPPVWVCRPGPLIVGLMVAWKPRCSNPSDVQTAWVDHLTGATATCLRCKQIFKTVSFLMMVIPEARHAKARCLFWYMGANFFRAVANFWTFYAFFMLIFLNVKSALVLIFTYFGCLEDPNYYGDLVDVVFCQVLKDDSNVQIFLHRSPIKLHPTLSS